MSTATRLRLPRSPFFDAVRKSGLLAPDDLVAFITQNTIDDATYHNPIKLAALFVRKKLLTKFQAMHLLKGKTRGFILDHYKILSGIRQDRVGMVFLAEDLNTRRQLTLKVLPTDRTSDNTILREFVKEVRNAARVDHPNVARVLDLCYWNGTHFVVSEFVDAPTLDKILEKGPLAPDAAAQLVAQVALALREVHQRGLFHRDIKPANIALLPDGRVKLLDLGLTHMLENPWTHVTKRIKTAEYAEEIDHVAPEQAWGNEPDARSDVYGLGSTFFTLLTGRSPFPGLAAEKMAERQVKDVPDPRLLNPNVPQQLSQIVQKMGARDPQNRYPSAMELLAALQPWLPISDWLTIAASLPADKPTGPPKRLTDTMIPALKPQRSWWRKLWPW
ncbi:serine/threonine protein kinase [Limnoglobus roseus]|uniref:Serine/threonine protein kinase n=1 Tax=Limnoglobus roseus TaxID=2598579 RepID=A0A5C1A3Q2_9BACT|nr:serine/threonine-protein kinase [Limnoglobus roseus]QEL13709.1 serine/threonine protein kinase [Limnoglobus roseus]